MKFEDPMETAMRRQIANLTKQIDREISDAMKAKRERNWVVAILIIFTLPLIGLDFFTRRYSSGLAEFLATAAWSMAICASAANRLYVMRRWKTTFSSQRMEIQSLLEKYLEIKKRASE